MKTLIWCPDKLLGSLVVHRLRKQQIDTSDPIPEDELALQSENQQSQALVVLYDKPIDEYCERIHRIKNNTAQPRLAIYILAWMQNESTVMNLLESGADEFLTLPLNLLRLMDKIHKKIAL